MPDSMLNNIFHEETYDPPAGTLDAAEFRRRTRPAAPNGLNRLRSLRTNLAPASSWLGLFLCTLFA